MYKGDSLHIYARASLAIPPGARKAGMAQELVPRPQVYVCDSGRSVARMDAILIQKANVSCIELPVSSTVPRPGSETLTIHSGDGSLRGVPGNAGCVRIESAPRNASVGVNST